MYFPNWLNRSLKWTKSDRRQARSRAASRHGRWGSGPALELLEARLVLSAAVDTDLDDYAPGETAFITTSNDTTEGTNFAIGETVLFQVTRTDGIEDYPSGNLPWSVTDGGEGDADGEANGSIQTSWLVEDQY